MTELERALVRLGDELDYPRTPDLSGPVLRRVDAAPSAPRRRPTRRTVALVLAVLAVAAGAALAVPQARTAILDFFGLRGVTVQRVETLPRVAPASERALHLGRPLPLVDGRPNPKLPEVLLPSLLGSPAAAYVSSESYGLRLSLVYGPGPGVPASPYTGVGIIVSEFVGEADPGFVDKMVAGDTDVERLQVGPFPALWLEGGPHAVLFRGDDTGRVFEDRGRLAGNTLLVERNDILVRIEGEISRERAIAIAESLE